jgi:hypothetical protein
MTARPWLRKAARAARQALPVLPGPRMLAARRTDVLPGPRRAAGIVRLRIPCGERLARARPVPRGVRSGGPRAAAPDAGSAGVPDAVRLLKSALPFAAAARNGPARPAPPAFLVKCAPPGLSGRRGGAPFPRRFQRRVI